MSSSSRRRAPRQTRPPAYSYNPKHLLEFPRRLLFPPNAPVGHVRSLKVTPIFQVSLGEVLDGNHLPPLTLKDFEDYLVFEERSAENLYFICWLRDYTAKYENWENAQAALPAEKRGQSDPDLTISFARARCTFFDPSSHLELNLPSDLVDGISNTPDNKAAPSGTSAALVNVQKHVEGMLRESLMKFVNGSCGNSGRRRGLFGIAVGVAAMLVGLAPVLMSALHGESRWVRLAALFPFWFGATTAIAGFHGVCVVIFLFGDARQLYPYELARPKLKDIPHTAPLELPMPVTTRAKSDGASYTETHASDDEGRMKAHTSLSSPFGDTEQDPKGGIPLSPISPTSVPLAYDLTASSQTMTDYKGLSFDGFVPETAGFIPSYPPSITQSQSRSIQSHGSSVPYKFDFDSLPPPPPTPRRSQEEQEQMSSIFRERGVFSSLTKVISPLITRAQWEIVMRSAMLGVLVALIIGGICFAVPFRH